MLANPKRTKDEIVQWIREYFAANGNDCCAVIGISGGKDSSVVAALCVEALGAERVIGVLMPNGRQKDIADSKLLVDTLGIASITVDIGGAYSKMVDVVGRAMPSGVSNQAAVNLPPRLRMATLYMVAQSLARGGRVANTCNRSEDYVGYSTKFGDSAGDFSPSKTINVIVAVTSFDYAAATTLRLLKMSCVCLGILENHNRFAVGIFCICRFNCNAECIPCVRIVLFASIALDCL